MREHLVSRTLQLANPRYQPLNLPFFPPSSRSKTIRGAMLKCIVLNGIIFLGSMLFFERLIMPALHFVFGVSTGENYNGTASLFFKAVHLWFRLSYNVYMKIWHFGVCESFTVFPVTLSKNVPSQSPTLSPNPTDLLGLPHLCCQLYFKLNVVSADC